MEGDNESNRTKRRDRKRHQRRHGMRVSGRRAAEIMRNVIIKRMEKDGEHDSNSK
jgi:hypothetical protein